jgi:hypothetical protein
MAGIGLKWRCIMMAKRFVYSFAAAGVCFTALAIAQSVTPAQSESTSGAQSTAAPTTSLPQQPGVPTHRVPALAALHQRLDMECNDVPLQQVVKMISRSTSLRVDIDPGVKSTVKLNLFFHNAPIYRVLEMIVHQPGTGMLMISPKAGGVILEPYPTREVNGKQVLNMGSNPPWSDAWDYNTNGGSAASAALTGTLTGTLSRTRDNGFSISGSSALPSQVQSGTSIGALPDQSITTSQTPPAAGQPGVGLPNLPVGASQQPAAEGIQVFGGAVAAPSPQEFLGGSTSVPVQEPFMGGGGPAAQGFLGMGAIAPEGYSLNGTLSVMVTALSDKSFVVTEPGLGPNREIGVYLTVYRIEGQGTKSGERIREVSHVFHRSANGGRPLTSRGAMPFMNPGANNPATRGMGGGGNFAPAQRSAGGAPQSGAGSTPRNPNGPTTPTNPNTPLTPAPADQRPGAGVDDPTGQNTPSGDLLNGGNKTPEDPFRNR